MTITEQARAIAEEIGHYLESYSPLSVNELVLKDLERIITRHVQSPTVTECIKVIERAGASANKHA